MSYTIAELIILAAVDILILLPMIIMGIMFFTLGILVFSGTIFYQAIKDNYTRPNIPEKQPDLFYLNYERKQISGTIEQKKVG